MDEKEELLDQLLDKIFVLGSSFAKEHPNIESKEYEEYGEEYSRLKDEVRMILLGVNE